MAVPAPIDPNKLNKPIMNKVPKPNTVPAPQSTTVKSSMSVPQSVGSAVPKPPQPKQTTFSAPQYNDWLTKQNETFANLEKMVNTPFNYNPETDPGYLAQRQLAQQRAGVATQNALEAANDRGIMGSSMTTNQLGQIQQNAEQEALAYIPQYREQAYSQYQNQLANASNLLGQARALRGDQFNEAVTEAGLTGSYLPAGAQQLVNQIYSLKSQAEQRGLPNTQVKALSAQADQLRAHLQAMGVDTSRLGADTALSNSAVGQRTLAGQQFDRGNFESDRNFDRGVLESDREFDQSVINSNRNYEMQMANLTGTLPDGTQTTAEQQRILSNLWMVAQQTGTIPNDLADMYGIKRGTRTQDAQAQAEQIAMGWANHRVSQQNANTSRYSAETSRNNADHSRLMDLWQATGVAPEGISGVPAGTPYASGSKGGKAETYDFKTDPDFNDDIYWINSNPAQALSKIRSKSQDIISQYGYNGYLELLKAAESVTPKSNSGFPNFIQQ